MFEHKGPKPQQMQKRKEIEEIPFFFWKLAGKNKDDSVAISTSLHWFHKDYSPTLLAWRKNKT
jgi:hypothetical protein